MFFERLREDETAVSPVIGVILMVAITVLLATVIGTFVLDIGEQQETVPQASFDFVRDRGGGTDTLTVTMTSGDNFETEQTAEVLVLGPLAQPSGGSGCPCQWATPVTAGDQQTYEVTGSGDVRVVWVSSKNTKRDVVATFHLT
jgi:flagellin-like protein